MTRKPYGELLRKVLSDLNLPHLLVEGPPPTVPPWAPVGDDSAGPQGAALAVDESTLREIPRFLFSQNGRPR